MNVFELYLVELLRGRISFDDRVVEVRRQFMPRTVLPCITLDTGVGDTTNYSFHMVDEKDNLFFNRSSTININVWCNTEEERESITSQIMDCYYKEKQFHYSYCGNYDDGNCGSGGRCRVSTTINRKTAKNKCPDPEAYGYYSLQAKHGIVYDTVRIEPPFHLDEPGSNPPLLRSVLRASADYEECVGSTGVRVENIDWGDLDVM